MINFSKHEVDIHSHEENNNKFTKKKAEAMHKNYAPETEKEKFSPESLVPVDIREQFEFDEKEQEKMMADFFSEMKKGLSGEESTLRMLPTFIDIPSGNEKGEFLALDLGGSNFRIMRVRLENGSANTVNMQSYSLNKNLTTGSKDNLFDFIANELKGFMDSNGISRKHKLPMGFTFSYPMKQIDAASGKLISWTKNFDIPEAIGSDPVEELQRAIGKVGVDNVEISALMNDAVGTLVRGSYLDNKCGLGVIIGTGTNAAYREKISNIKKQDIDISANEHMIVDTEWGNFDKLAANKYDQILDSNSNNQGQYLMEKKSSGNYLGELFGLVIQDLTEKSKFSAETNELLSKLCTSFTSKTISNILEDDSADLYHVEKKLKSIGIDNSTAQDRKLIKDAAKMIVDRSVHIIATAIASVIKKIDPELTEEHKVAVDGSLYEKLPGYKRALEKQISIILNKKVLLFLSKDGSGVGAAIAAASVVKNTKK